MNATATVGAGPAPSQPVASALLPAIVSTVGMTVLVGSEALFAAVALDWAGGGLLHLPASLHLALGAVPVAAAMYATYWVARRTWQYERSEALLSAAGPA
ncbi:hypothetical protein [Microbaculum marinum]|uniref:Uncharacterized protein n=1 Tax=Microbaculum marinum TaxID=1764581 RepID=A0AAW9RNI5_9HYPH